MCVDGSPIYEHRHVMMQKLGRKLAKGEQVHHKNEVKYDNAIDNLVVLPPKEHAAAHAKTSYDIESAIKLYREGVSFAAIARRVGAYSATDVWKALARRGIHRPKHRHAV